MKSRKLTLLTITALLLIVGALTTATVFAAGHRSTEDVVQLFDSLETATVIGDIVGTADLTRSEDGLTAIVRVSGMNPGGVYTFWWLVGEPFALPDVFVASGGGLVVHEGGRATVRMTLDKEDKGIEGFLNLGGAAPFFDDLDLIDLLSAEVHVEIAYHGQAEAAGDDLGTWLSNFWTGTACPQGPESYNPGGTVGAYEFDNHIGQPHCPVSYIAIFP